MKHPKKIYLDQNTINDCIQSIDNFKVELDYIEYDISYFKEFERIIIVGLQRSGTTFTAQAIAKTLNYKFIDEGAFRVKNSKIFKQLIQQSNIVVQAPSMTYKIQTLVSENDLVVFMNRKWSDIVKSVYRKNNKLSNWIFMKTMYEVDKFYFTDADPNCLDTFNTHVDINSYYLDSYYKIWKHYQSSVIKNNITLDYESMKNHPLWIDKTQRTDFSPKQTGI